jgi:ribosomal protein L13E
LNDKPRQAESTSGTLDAAALPAEALSGPNVIRYRAVTETDIARLRMMERPISLIAAALFGGIMLACSYPVYQIVTHVRAGAGQGVVSLTDLGVVASWAGSLGISVAAGIVSIRRRSKIIETLELMARRPSLPVAQPTRAGRPSQAPARTKRRRFSFRRKTKIAV